jgi:hypothetical protein
MEHVVVVFLIVVIVIIIIADFVFVLFYRHYDHIARRFMQRQRSSIGRCRHDRRSSSSSSSSSSSFTSSSSSSLSSSSLPVQNFSFVCAAVERKAVHPTPSPPPPLPYFLQLYAFLRLTSCSNIGATYVRVHLVTVDGECHSA